jgi:hypothetical protein
MVTGACICAGHLPFAIPSRLLFTDPVSSPACRVCETVNLTSSANDPALATPIAPAVCYLHHCTSHPILSDRKELEQLQPTAHRDDLRVGARLEIGEYPGPVEGREVSHQHPIFLCSQMTSSTCLDFSSGRLLL